MCEIQMIFGKKLKTKDLYVFENMMLNGFTGNNDSTGFFNNEAEYSKNKEYVSICNNPTMLLKKMFVIGHNRLTTGGNPNENKNNHPFIYKNWLMVHNGVITNKEELKNIYGCGLTEPETDSYMFLKGLVIEIDKVKGNFKKGFKKFLQNLRGYFSITLFNYQNNKLYYFKSWSPSMFFGYKKQVLKVASTNEDTLSRLKKSRYIDEYVAPKDLMVYEYDPETQDFCDLFKFKYQEYCYTSECSYFENDCENRKEWWEQKGIDYLEESIPTSQADDYYKVFSYDNFKCLTQDAKEDYLAGKMDEMLGYVVPFKLEQRGHVMNFDRGTYEELLQTGLVNKKEFFKSRRSYCLPVKKFLIDWDFWMNGKNGD